MSKTRALGKPSLVRRLVPRRLTLRGGLLVLVLACALLCSVSPVLAAETSARTAEDIQARWVQLMPSFVFDRGPDSRYVTLPSFHAPYQAGSLAPAYLQDGINYLNYVRYLAGLPDDVTLDASYNTLAQHGAVLSWVSGIGLTHTPTKPADMDQAFYDLGLRGTRSSNIASGGGLRGAIEVFMCDDDPSNISRVGHRRWLLNPAMQKTGMGDAHSVLVYAHDRSRPEDVPYDVIAWPSAGLFPVEMFSAVQGWPQYADPWSITLNPALYWWTEGAAGHTITLQRRGDGRTWTFTSADTDLSGEYFTLDTTAFGVANCFIFRPDPKTLPMYEVGDIFDVTLSGGIFHKSDNSPATISYTTEFMAQYLFRDAMAEQKYYRAIYHLAKAGVVSGYQDGTFKSYNPVLRAQFAKMATLSLDLAVTEGTLPVPFWDVEKPTTSLYPDDYVAVAAANDLILGYSDGSFRPYVDISRAQLLTIVVRAAEHFKPGALTTPLGGWKGTLPASDPTHGANIAKAEYSGLLSGIDLAAFSVWKPATRGEVAQILWNLREK